MSLPTFPAQPHKFRARPAGEMRTEPRQILVRGLVETPKIPAPPQEQHSYFDGAFHVMR